MLQEIHSLVFSSPYMGIVLCVLAYEIGVQINRKTKQDLCNPLLISMIIVIGVLYFCKVDYEVFDESASKLTFLLTPASVAFAIPLYRQLEVLKKNLGVILAGIGVGCLTACLSVFGLSKLFGLDQQLFFSLLPKSLTTPIAVGVSEELGGYVSITIIAVLITGIVGAAVIPTLCKVLPLHDPIGIGLGIGTSSHALGTSKALEMGELQGAMSSLSIAVAGIITVVLAPVISMLY